MARALFESLGLFLAPFALFALYLMLRRSKPFAQMHWPIGTVSLLAVAGLLFAIGGLLIAGIFADRATGNYVPAHIENGRAVPGRFQ